MMKVNKALVCTAAKVSPSRPSPVLSSALPGVILPPVKDEHTGRLVRAAQGDFAVLVVCGDDSCLDTGLRGRGAGKVGCRLVPGA